jgi:hypothetical protein
MRYVVTLEHVDRELEQWLANAFSVVLSASTIGNAGARTISRVRHEFAPPLPNDRVQQIIEGLIDRASASALRLDAFNIRDEGLYRIDGNEFLPARMTANFNRGQPKMDLCLYWQLAPMLPQRIGCLEESREMLTFSGRDVGGIGSQLTP